MSDSAEEGAYDHCEGISLTNDRFSSWSLILLKSDESNQKIGWRNRKSTQDIDVVVATNDRRTYQAIQHAIQLMATERNLPSSWMKDDVTLVVDQIGKPKTPRVWKTFANLAVYIPEFEYILALKHYSDASQRRFARDKLAK